MGQRKEIAIIKWLQSFCFYCIPVYCPCNSHFSPNHRSEGRADLKRRKIEGEADLRRKGLFEHGKTLKRRDFSFVP
jgi:hypothetical protein